MIIVPLKEGENIERALKRFKRKFEKTGAIRELRARKNFVKPSVKKREQIQKAIYVQHMQLEDEQSACTTDRYLTKYIADRNTYPVSFFVFSRNRIIFVE